MWYHCIFGVLNVAASSIKASKPNTFLVLPLDNCGSFSRRYANLNGTVGVDNTKFKFNLADCVVDSFRISDINTPHAVANSR